MKHVESGANIITFPEVPIQTEMNDLYPADDSNVVPFIAPPDATSSDEVIIAGDSHRIEQLKARGLTRQLDALARGAIAEFLEDATAGEAKVDPEVIKKINALTNRHLTIITAYADRHHLSDARPSAEVMAFPTQSDPRDFPSRTEAVDPIKLKPYLRRSEGTSITEDTAPKPAAEPALRLVPPLEEPTQ